MFTFSNACFISWLMSDEISNLKMSVTKTKVVKIERMAILGTGENGKGRYQKSKKTNPLMAISRA